MSEWQITSIIVAIFTAIITAILGIIQAFLNLSEKKKRFSFERLKMAKELIDELYGDEKAPKALLMIDERTVKYNNTDVGSKNEIVDALKNEKYTDGKYYFIRDCFDELFYYIERIEHSIDSNLIRFEDVKPYFSYYIKDRIKKEENLYIDYANNIHFTGVKNFINRFN